jgi:hypothetical protein
MVIHHLEKARTNVILGRPYVWDCESGLERAVAWVVVNVEHRVEKVKVEKGERLLFSSSSPSPSLLVSPPPRTAQMRTHSSASVTFSPSIYSPSPSLTSTPYPSGLFLRNDDDSSDDFDIIDGSPLSVRHNLTVTRPSSPSASLDFSIVSPPSPSPDRNSYPFESRHGRSQLNLFPQHWSGFSSRDKRYNTAPGSPSSYRVPLSSDGNRTPPIGKSMKRLLPRLWVALSSPSRKGRRKADRRKLYALPSNISYADLQPLDGEEGELIDEACFVEPYDAPQSPPRKFIGPFSSSLCPRVFLKPTVARLLVSSPIRDRGLSPMLSRSFVCDRLPERLTYMVHRRQ